ncbi:hypothetical protein [Parvicella tangerina]|uniref:Uncharacterized protein n=1 Tax=Parvicella tangerina TaxID=2829795 RepID=A0A916JNF2_9FLAO|nr:hypothetical protein [Parvicella tangerina]CAG5083877.1 hypothetical protein CRYO30217_02318 [Parvicella tangerina]
MRTINDEILPKELLQIIENDELEWDGGALITSIDYFADDAKIELSILLDRSEEKRQLWEVQLEGIRNENIKREWAEDIGVYNQHYLIKEQMDLNSELYLKNPTTDSNKLLHDLYVHFLSKFEYNIPFDKYLNKTSNIDFLLKMDNGLFAKGPKFILEEIDTVLKNHKCETYFFGETPAKRWLDNQWINETSDLIVLTIGESYFVAENITFKRA